MSSQYVRRTDKQRIAEWFHVDPNRPKVPQRRLSGVIHCSCRQGDFAAVTRFHLLRNQTPVPESGSPTIQYKR